MFYLLLRNLKVVQKEKYFSLHMCVCRNHDKFLKGKETLNIFRPEDVNEIPNYTVMNKTQWN